MPIRKTAETVKKVKSSADTRNVSPETTRQSMKKITARGREQLLIDLATGIRLILVKIDAGSFMMGSPEGELGKGANETLHQVVLTKDYWIGKYPVTQEQYAAVVGKNPSGHVHWGSNIMERPVENISWCLARRFCSKLNRMIARPSGYRFDLPTEAQWEYACRAGTTTALNSGRDLTVDWGKCPHLAQVGWYEGNGITCLSVGQKKPNAWGLYDMHGNVHEWCRDWYEREYAADPEFLEGQAKCQFRVARGGCYRSDPEECRSASRDCFEPTERSYDLGFRLALVPIKK